METPCSSYLSSAMAPMVRTDATTVRWDMKFVTRQNLEPNDQSLEISYWDILCWQCNPMMSRISINLTYFSWTRSWKYCWILYLLGPSAPSWKWRSWWLFSFFCFLNIRSDQSNRILYKIRYWCRDQSLTWLNLTTRFLNSGSLDIITVKVGIE